MGLLEALLGANNPAAQWANQNSNFLGAIGAGLGQGQNIQSGLSAGLAAVPQAKALDRENAEKAKADAKLTAQTNATKAWIEQNYPQFAHLPVEQAWELATAYEKEKISGGSANELPNSVQEFEYARANGFDGSYMEWLSGKGGATERSLTPTYLRDENGNIVIGQLDKGGSVTPSQLPEGYTAIDPFAMAGGKTGATVDAKTVGAARAALPGMETAVSIAQKAFELVRNDEKGRKAWFSQWGALPRGMYVQGGSDLANFQTNAGQTLAQAFSQARETLKGGGPITDYEGKAATEAYSRAESALRQGDEQAYLQAIDDMEAAILAGYQKLVDAAQGDPTGGALTRAAPPAPAGNSGAGWTVIGVE